LELFVDEFPPLLYLHNSYDPFGPHLAGWF
jgi:hypothetical protein